MVIPYTKQNQRIANYKELVAKYWLMWMNNISKKVYEGAPGDGKNPK